LAAQIVGRFIEHDHNLLTISYTLSTFNPYTVVLM